MKKIPDEVTFGINSLNERIDYGYVRNIKDDDELIRLLRIRLHFYLIKQVQPLYDAGANSAFPLAIMTCIGIETLGKIFVSENKDDTSFQFVETSKKISQFFGRKPTKNFLIRLSEIWSEKDLSKIDSYGKILYRFFRNTMIHGYQGKGVFLDYSDAIKIEIMGDSGFIVFNPGWLWDKFKESYEKQFSDALQAQTNNKERQHCLQYIRDFLLL